MNKLLISPKKIIIIIVFVYNIIILCYSYPNIILKPNKLKELVSGGYVIVKEENGFDFLHLKTKPLTPSQQQRIELLKSLGYVSGTFEIGGINPILAIPFDLSEIGEVILIFNNNRNDKLSVRLAINNFKEECLYHKELSNNDVIKQFENKSDAIIFKINLYHLIEPVIISLEFKSCDMLIKEVQIR